ncbi:2-aminoethanethiol dioxygenase [Procambarus clarkii]|uniref:2-aminoethanethiol dioxygenase n=1 Tax=Procambarus clarkii TaxID=6728 RepID=UPI001E6758C8|nr:2-aminoethanethiol dioxygenase-like [Procambarus clarkii]
MSSVIQKLGRLAVKTFRRDPQVSEAAFTAYYEQLYSLLNTVTTHHLNLDPRLIQDRGTFNASRDGAPVTYMQLYEDSDVTICVFILKRGVRLPLHDHPGMYGLLKVVHGSVSIQSYSFIDTNIEENQSGLMDSRSHPSIFPAIKHQQLIVSASDNACQLRPGKQNIHEIYSLNGPAAFLDILSPPYGNDELLGMERECHYYREIDGNWNNPQLSDGNCVLLLSIPTPSDFWCDQTDYQGPTIGQDGEENS